MAAEAEGGVNANREGRMGRIVLVEGGRRVCHDRACARPEGHSGPHLPLCCPECAELQCECDTPQATAQWPNGPRHCSCALGERRAAIDRGEDRFWRPDLACRRCDDGIPA